MEDSEIKKELAEIGTSIGKKMADLDEKSGKVSGEVEKLWAEMKKANSEADEREKALNGRANDLEKLVISGGRAPDNSLNSRIRKALDGGEKSAIQAFAKSYKSNAGKQGFMVEVETVSKAVGDFALTNFTGEMSTRQRLPGVVGSPYRIHARDILPSVRSTERITEWIRHTGGEGGPAYHVDGTLKAQTDLDFDLVTITPQRIAHWARFPDSWINDYSAIIRYIEVNMVEQLFNFQDVQILTGAGGAGAINGLITQAVLMADPFPTTPVTPATNIDVIVAAFAALSARGVNQGGFNPNFIMVNPIDYYRLIITKDTQGNYVMPNLVTSDANSVMGVPVIMHQAVPADMLLVGDLNYCQLQFHEPMSIAFSTETGNNFIQNMITVKVEESVKLIVMNPNAFLKIGFAAGRTLIAT